MLMSGKSGRMFPGAQRASTASSRRSRCAGAAADPVAVALDDADRGPARALDARRRRLARPRRRGRAPARPARRAAVEQLEALLRARVPLLEPGLDVARPARRGRDRLEAARTRAAGWSPAHPRRPGGPRRRAGRASPARVLAAEDADVVEPVQERAVEQQLRHATEASARIARERRARRRDRRRVELQRGAPDRDAAEEEPVAGRARRRAARALDQRQRTRWCRPRSPMPAQTAAMSLRWLQSRSSSSRSVRARASVGGGLEAAQPLDGLRVGDGVGDRAGRAGPLRRPRARRPATGPRRGAPVRGACRTDARRGAGCGRRRRGSGSGPTRSRRRGWARRRPGTGRAVDRDRPRGEVRIVPQQRPQRLVAGERHAVAIVRLALVPLGRRCEVDDRRRALATPSRTWRWQPSGRRRAASAPRRRRGRGGRRSDRPAPAPRRSARDSRASCQRAQQRVAHPDPGR